MRKHSKINIVFAPYSINGGMAVGKRLKNLVFYMKNDIDLSLSNFYITQKGLPDVEFIWKDVKQVKVTSNRFVAHFSLYLFLLKQKSDYKNVLYYYGTPNVFNFWLLYFIRKQGYKVVVDIVEDYSTISKFAGIFNFINIKILLMLYKKLDKFCDGVVVISKYLERKMAADFRNILPTILLPISINKTDYDIFQVRNSDDFVFFYGGSFAHKDGVSELTYAFNEVSKKYPFVKLVLTGKVANNNDLILLNETLSQIKNPRIVYLGFISDSYYFELINSSDVLCMPRKNIPFALAGFPFKIGEYMMTGNVVLASKIGELSEFFSDAEVCFYEPDSIESLIGKMKELIMDEDLRKSTGMRAKCKAIESFDAKIHTQKLRQFIDLL